MSSIAFRPRGGQEGIDVTSWEMNLLADMLGASYSDKVIPLPNVDPSIQKERLQTCKEHENAQYWETETGKHGWCCNHCGTVVQWG